jgi:O-antigen/teichoic acid export membrane protein
MIKRLLSNQIIKNFSVLTGTNLAMQFLSIFSSIRLARLLQPDGYGLYNLIMVQAGMFSIIAAFGLNIVILRYVARNKSDSKYIFHVSNKIRLVTTLLAVLCLLIYNIFINKAPLTPLFLLLISICVIFQSFWDSIQCIAFGNEKMESSGYISFLFTGFWVLSVYVIPKVYFNINVLITFYVFFQLTKTISYYFWLNKKILSKDQTSINNLEINIKSIIKQSNYFFILAIFTGLQNQVPILMLNQTSKLDQVGIFNLGNRILSPMQMALGMALTSLYPSLSRLALVNKELFTKRIKNLLNLLMIAGVWGCICFTLFSKEVVLLLYGKAYVDSAKVILIQCWFTMLYAIFCTIGTVLSSFDKQRQLAILSMIYGILSLPIFWFGAKNGAIGLAWAFVIAAYLNMTYHWIVFKNILSPYLNFGYSLKLFSIIIISTICSLFIPFEYNLFLKLVVGILITIIAGYYIKDKVLMKILQ